MTTKKERYLQLKHEKLNDCGQCIGFRAKGIDLTKSEEKPACEPSIDCHKTCPALGLGAKSKVQEPKREPKQVEKTYLPQTCHKCGNNEDNVVLLPCRQDGQSLWVCTRCLPALIHG